MSRTATVTTDELANLENVLQDYKIRLSAAPEPELTAAQREDQGRRECLAASNPSNWPTNFRRVPNYRPINRYLDPEQRPNGANTVEYVFVNVMLNGVRLQSVSGTCLFPTTPAQLFLTSSQRLVTLYEATGGKIWPGLTRYDIGGEW